MTPADNSPPPKPPKAKHHSPDAPPPTPNSKRSLPHAHIDHLAATAKAIPAKITLGQARPDAVRITPERKRIHDASRMATYNAESALARLLAPHYARADDEARTLLREAFRTPADLQIIGNELHVTLNPLTAPRRTRAINGLCNELTATRTLYPGTNLTLVYTTKTGR